MIKKQFFTFYYPFLYLPRDISVVFLTESKESERDRERERESERDRERQRERQRERINEFNPRDKSTCLLDDLFSGQI